MSRHNDQGRQQGGQYGGQAGSRGQRYPDEDRSRMQRSRAGSNYGDWRGQPGSDDEDASQGWGGQSGMRNPGSDYGFDDTRQGGTRHDRMGPSFGGQGDFGESEFYGRQSGGYGGYDSPRGQRYQGDAGQSGNYAGQPGQDDRSRRGAQEGYAAFGNRANQGGDQQFDPDYHQWRREQMQALDEDYRNWREDRYKKFSDEFSTWRKGRNKGSSSMMNEDDGIPGGNSSSTGSGTPSTGSKASK